MIAFLIAGGFLASSACLASDVVASPRVLEFRHSVRIVPEVATEVMDRGVPVRSPRHEANRVVLAPNAVEDRMDREVRPVSPRVRELRRSVR